MLDLYSMNQLLKTVIRLLFFGLLSTPCLAQPKAELAQAEILFDKNNFEEALPLYSELEQQKDHPMYHYICYKKAFCLYELIQYDEALTNVKQALQISKNQSRYKWIKGSSYWLEGRIYSKKEENKKALQSFYKAADYVPESRLYATIGYKEIQLKQYKKALVNLNKAIELDSKTAYAYSNRAWLYIHYGKLKEARTDITTAIRLDPNNPYAYKHRALIFIELKELDKACEDLHKAEQLGYYDFGNEADKNEVGDLLLKYCNASPAPVKK